MKRKIFLVLTSVGRIFADKIKVMKKILSMMLAAVAVFSACIKNEPKDPEGTGTFSLNLSYEGEFQTKADVPYVNIEDRD